MHRYKFRVPHDMLNSLLHTKIMITINDYCAVVTLAHNAGQDDHRGYIQDRKSHANLDKSFDALPAECFPPLVSSWALSMTPAYLSIFHPTIHCITEVVK